MNKEIIIAQAKADKLAAKQERLKQQKYIVEIDSSILDEVLKQGIDKNF